ncbi:uncharacterized protein GGS25DRAFT_533529 [Hypoxylon fragiforme]|uniref:uncharacterized protein n=1 Tax=Hypoxylon fragiforme TaxID=63214 RepID=UPI0020C6308F|nr:uncharacterized protein GGS25DRAFT_533529 [Hypoxylon fragiforme]KAI2606449.1 hypothetical protein GGS25DRAFT_533529 [Hypoxylon fragiforme]
MAPGKLTLHHLKDSQSQLILWPLEELGIEYELVTHLRDASGRAPAALRAVHALGKAPTLVTPSGRVLSERSAITLWLLHHYDEEGRPFRLPSCSSDADAEHRDDLAREEQLMSVGSTTLHTPLLLKAVFGRMARQAPFLLRWVVVAIGGMLDSAFVDGEIRLVMTYLDGELALPEKKEGEGEGEGKEREWFMGTKNPTRVDFSMMWYVDWAVRCGWLDIAQYPRVKAWRDRILERPAWKRSIEKTGGYDPNL